MKSLGNLGRYRIYFIVAVVSLLVGGLVVAIGAYQVMPISASQVERVFVDIDGNGTLDFLVEGSVIYNTGFLDQTK